MLKQSYESIKRQEITELGTVGEFSLGDIVFSKKAANEPVEPRKDAQAVASNLIPIWKSSGYIRPFADYRPKDIGNAQRFFDLYADEFRFAPHLGWLRYEKGIWGHTEGFGYEREAVKSTICKFGDSLKIELFEINKLLALRRKAKEDGMSEAYIESLDDDVDAARGALKRMNTEYEASCAEPKIGACLRIAASAPAFVVRPEQLDADDFKLNTLSGVLDLIHGTETPHDPAFLMTRTSGTSIGPVDAECPEWLKFLHAVFDDGNEVETQAMIDYMQVVIAYMLSGSTRFEAMFILGGIAGGNGKSTFLNVVNALLGTYGMQVDCKTFQFKNAEDSSIPNDLAKTAGSRGTTIDELPKGFRFNSPMVKAYVSGTTPMTARFLHKEYFSWLSKAKVMIATNFLPVIRDDEAMWRRIHLIKFNNNFKARPDETLGAKLNAELPAIMRWAQQGITKLAASGLGMPERVARDTATYKGSQDDFGSFVIEKMEPGAGFIVKTSQAFAMYTVWAEENKHHAMSKGTFRRTMAERGFAVKTKSGYEVFDGLQVQVDIS